MEFLKVGESEIVSSRLVYGCMRIFGDGSVSDQQKGKIAIQTAFDEGFNHFDHADIYGNGKCEELFAAVLNDIPGMREKICITSKCGIRGKDNPHQGDPARYDFSKDYIIKSTESSLLRLEIETLDILLLHRPDFLMNAEEVAAAFDHLKISGKVRYFGVSNFSPSQLSLLQDYCSMPLVINQVEINIHNIISLTDGTLDQCQQLNISPQAWCPLGGVAYQAWGNTFTEIDEKRILNELNDQSKKYNVDKEIIMLAWLIKHPANIFPIIGSTTPKRIKSAKRALEIDYRREDWYRLLEARNGHPVP